MNELRPRPCPTIGARRPRVRADMSRLAPRLRGRPRGLGLIEIVASTFLVGALLVGSLAAVAGIFRTWGVAESRLDASALAQAVLAEILPQHYEDPDDPPEFGLEPSEEASDRSTWDDVDDYDGWNSAPADRTGKTLAGLDGWQVRVSVEYVRLDDPARAGSDDEGLKRVTVTVADPSGQATILVGYRSRFGGLETPLAVSALVQTRVTCSIQMAAGRQLHGGSALFNYAEDQ